MTAVLYWLSYWTSSYFFAMTVPRFIQILEITKWHISYVPLDPVADYTHVLNLITRLRAGWKTLPNLKFKLRFQTQISKSNLNFKKLKSSPFSRVICYSGELTPRIKGMKATKQWVGFQVKKSVAQRVGQRRFKILVLSSCFHFVGLEETVSSAKRKLVSSCLGIIYLAPGISNPVGPKLSRWHLGINSFGANLGLRRNCTQRGYCLAGAKLSHWYFRNISSRHQLGST